MIRRRLGNKKADIGDLIFIAIIVLIFAVVTLITFKIMDELNTKFQGESFITDRGKTASSSINNMFPTVIDNVFLILIIGLCIAMLALAMLVRIHPIFFVFYIMILFFTIFLAGVFANIYLEIANKSEFIGLAEQLTFTTHLMQLLPLIVGVVGFVLAIVLYKTWSAEQQ